MSSPSFFHHFRMLRPRRVACVI
jgi:hypothetical protein